MKSRMVGGGGEEKVGGLMRTFDFWEREGGLVGVCIEQTCTVDIHGRKKRDTSALWEEIEARKDQDFTTTGSACRNFSRHPSIWWAVNLR